MEATHVIERTARCCCGDFSITVSGEPQYVHRCHCDYCQRRTGSVFQVSCWFSPDQVVSRRGTYRSYAGHPNLESSFGPSGQSPPATTIDYRFCENCGSTVYWEIPLPPGTFGPAPVVVTAIAVGCFFEADFPAPSEDHYVGNRHHWIDLLDGVPSFEKLPPAGDVRDSS